MGIKRTTLTVLMADQPEEPIAVPVILGDQLRAELEGRKMGVDLKMGIHTTALWAWAAMTRLGLYEGKFREFGEACLTAQNADEDEPAPDVDPTQQDQSTDSASG